MERLTTRHNGVAVIRDKSKHKEAMEKLARYEELEEQGRLLELPAPLDGVEMFDLEGIGLWLRMPCYIGDTVYEIAGEKWVGDRDWQYRSYKDAYIEETKFNLEKYHQVGRTVFLTKAEAEKALAEMEK